MAARCSLLFALIAGLAGLTGCSAATTTEIRDPSSARPATYVVGGAAIVAAGTSVAFVAASSSENSAIKDGGLATGTEIRETEQRGRSYNEVAFVSGAAAVMLVGATIALYLYSSGSSEQKTGATSTTKPTMLRSLLERGGLSF